MAAGLVLDDGIPGGVRPWQKRQRRRSVEHSALLIFWMGGDEEADVWARGVSERERGERERAASAAVTGLGPLQGGVHRSFVFFYSCFVNKQLMHVYI